MGVVHRFWDRLPFVARLLITASVALIVAGLAMLYASARNEGAEADADLRAQLENELASLPPSLSELLVIGDFATVEQTLSRNVLRANVSRLVYRDNTGVTLQAADSPPPPRAPAWFARWLGLQDYTGERSAVVGGRVYGTLEATITARHAVDRVWAHLARHLSILALAVALDFLGIWLVLRTGLKPLRALDEASLALGRGDLSVRIPEQGSPEFRHSIAAFNGMAANIQQLNDTLEQKVRERTAELAASNRELEAFSYSVSHDLRAPLRAIDGFASVIAEDYGDRLDETGRAHLARIRQASQRMSALIDDVLELARISRAELTRSPVNLSELTHTVVEELPDDSERSGTEFLIADNLHAVADRGLLHVVLQNLVHNAWKFTGRTPQARIEFGTALTAGERAFFVRDNGAGFDPAYAHKLFQAFQRLHRPDEFPGTGVGLATVKRVIERHGGRVWAEGAVGRGATFYFTLG
jgi:signal transduction histidine kinase